MNWFDAHNDPDPPAHQVVWVQTKSGIVATGHFTGYWWYTDGVRVKNSMDPVWYWAVIEYPEGVKDF